MAVQLAPILLKLIKPLVWGIAIAYLVYYYATNITGESLANVSIEDFLRQIGACGASGACDINNVPCLFCPYIRELIDAIGNASAAVYNAFISHIWILMILGFGIYAVLRAWHYLKEAADKTADISDLGEKTFDVKKWFEDLWKQAIRIIVVGVVLGAIGTMGYSAPRMISDITIRPILSMGTYISTGVAGLPGDLCNYDQGISDTADSLITDAAIQPLMCMSGILNTITFMGANQGFALMNDSSGPLLWFLGLIVVVIFALYGIKIFFELMNIVFTVIFFIMFLPVIIASLAFREVWKVAGNVADNVLNQITSMAVMMIAIALKLAIFYSIMKLAIDNNPDSGFGLIATILFVFIFYYYVVEARLAKQFANINTDLFFKFGDNAYTTMKAGIDWVGNTLTKITKFGITK